MFDDTIKTKEELENLLLSLGLLTLKEDTNEYLKSSLTTFYENRKTAEQNTIKYSVRSLLSFFFYVVLMSTKVEALSFGFFVVKDLSVIQIFFPVVILYYSLLMTANDLFRIQSLILHYNVQSILYPEIITKNLSMFFTPFSFLNLMATNPVKKGLFKFLHSTSYFLLFGFITFNGFFAFFLSIQKGISTHLFSNSFFLISILVQSALVMLTIAAFIRKLNVMKLLNRKS